MKSGSFDNFMACNSIVAGGNPFADKCCELKGGRIKLAQHKLSIYSPWRCELNLGKYRGVEMPMPRGNAEGDRPTTARKQTPFHSLLEGSRMHRARTESSL